MAIANVNGQPVVPFVGGTRGIVEFLGAGIQPGTANSTVSRTPGFERILLAQLLSPGSSALSSITTGDDDIFGDTLFGGLLAGVGPINNNTISNSDIFGSSLGSALAGTALPGLASPNSLAVQLFSAVNTSQGKRVEARNPGTGQNVTGTVTLVELSNGRVLLTLDVPNSADVVVPAESILKVFPQ